MSTHPLANDLDLDFLHDISSRFAAEDPLHQDLERIIEFASAVVKCDSCLIYIREADDLVLRASKNPLRDRHAGGRRNS
jgi:uroporphyrinogen-III synthase